MQDEVRSHAPELPIGAPRVDELAALYRLTDRLYRAHTLDDVYESALDAITETLGCRRASVLLFDEAGVMRFVAWRDLSETYRRAVDGHTPWKPGERDPEPVFVVDIDEADEPDWLKATIRGEDIRALGFFPIVSQGGVVGKFMTYYSERHGFDAHEIDMAVAIARQVGFSVERARAEQARRAAQEELRLSEERFRLMAEHAPVMIWRSAPDGHCLHLNAMLRQFWNVGEDAIPGFDWSQMMHPDDAPEIGARISAAHANREAVTLEGRYLCADGSYRVLMTEARPHFTARGAFAGMIGVNVDITERKQAEQHRQLLIHELNHRVKNTLAVVQSMARQTFGGRDGERDSRLPSFEARLAALARAHNMLADENWENASLEQVARQALAASISGDSRVAFGGPPVPLAPKQAVTVAMALHELYTNAVKYGALSVATGTVRFEWSKGEGQRLTMTWREEGGPPVARPERRGFGSVMIEQALRTEFAADVALDFRPEGLVLTVDAPLPANTAGREP